MTDLAPTETHTRPTRTRIDATPLAVIRHDGIGLGDLDDLFDADYSVLNSAAAAGLFEIAGPPLAVFRGDAATTFDVEIGMPVVAPLTGDGPDGIRGSELPAGDVVVLTHVGSYGGLGGCWRTLVAGAEATPTDTWAEVYVDEPGLVADEQLRTDCLLYVRD